MVSLLGFSQQTIERRLADLDLSIRNTYIEISDIELDEKVRGISEYWLPDSIQY